MKRIKLRISDHVFSLQAPWCWWERKGKGIKTDLISSGFYYTATTTNHYFMFVPTVDCGTFTPKMFDNDNMMKYKMALAVDS